MPRENTRKVYTLDGEFWGPRLYAGIVIIDLSEVQMEADRAELFYALQRTDIIRGREYQVDSGGDLLMEYSAYRKGQKILKRFGAKRISMGENNNLVYLHRQR